MPANSIEFRSKPEIKREHQEIEEAINILLTKKCSPDEVLPRLYSLELLRKYLDSQVQSMRSEIIDFFSKKYRWNDTGDEVEFNAAFFEYHVGYASCKDLKEFKKIFKMTTDPGLIEDLHERIVLCSEYRDINPKLL